jgi:hypothetical protein
MQLQYLSDAAQLLVDDNIQAIHQVPVSWELQLHNVFAQGKTRPCSAQHIVHPTYSQGIFNDLRF